MLTKHDERKMPKNRGHIETLAGIMMEQTSPPMARIVAAKVLLDRGWGKPKEMHHSEVDDNKPLLKVVNEIVPPRRPRARPKKVGRIFGPRRWISAVPDWR